MGYYSGTVNKTEQTTWHELGSTLGGAAGAATVHMCSPEMSEADANSESGNLWKLFPILAARGSMITMARFTAFSILRCEGEVVKW